MEVDSLPLLLKGIRMTTGPASAVPEGSSCLLRRDREEEERQGITDECTWCGAWRERDS